MCAVTRVFSCLYAHVYVLEDISRYHQEIYNPKEASMQSFHAEIQWKVWGFMEKYNEKLS